MVEQEVHTQCSAKDSDAVLTGLRQGILRKGRKIVISVYDGSVIRVENMRLAKNWKMCPILLSV